MATTAKDNMVKAIAWCLAWGDQKTPNPEFDDLREVLKSEQFEAAQASLPKNSKALLDKVKTLQAIDEAELQANYPRALEELQSRYSQLHNEKTSIGLVLGGATKIKQYVFESANLQDIRGASALLDRINLTDLVAFFDAGIPSTVRPWFESTFPQLATALIPELVIYSTGGNILAFCPAAFVNDLADAIERCYTHETLTANSAAVGETFQLLELRFGRLRQPWLQQYLDHTGHPIFQAYFDQPVPSDTHLTEADYIRQFSDRKAFNELVTHLARRFNQRRSGNTLPGRSQARAYPPMFETHAYLHRDASDHRSSTIRIPADSLPSNPKFSETSARKYVMGQIAKRETQQSWWPNAIGTWQPGRIKSWVRKFLEALPSIEGSKYGQGVNLEEVDEARTLREIGDSSHSKGYVAYIYADGNNMGGYIQSAIKTPEAYQQFSHDVSYATEHAVYRALDRHLEPTWYTPDARSGRRNIGVRIQIHPFEILTIGGDDVLLIVPADKALAITQTLCQEFEHILCQRNAIYRTAQTYSPDQVHRYRDPKPSKRASGTDQCQLSMSAGVLITADNTPIYYADRLVGQLLKSAKRKAKTLRGQGYWGGTIDFLTLKSVTMISSNVDEFRSQGLTRERPDQPTLKLYGAPYTLYEIGGLLNTVNALHTSGLPRSQIYQIRSLLEQGKKTAMLNYRYFRARLKEKGNGLDTDFEQAWCWAQTNGGTLSPWRYVGDRIYETIWRDLVDLYGVIPSPDTPKSSRSPAHPRRQSMQSR
jgi:CRISPR-associated protein Cmr2